MVTRLSAPSRFGGAHIISNLVFRHSLFHLLLLSLGANGSREHPATWWCLTMFDPCPSCLPFFLCRWCSKLPRLVAFAVFNLLLYVASERSFCSRLMFVSTAWGKSSPANKCSFATDRKQRSERMFLLHAHHAIDES